jgi:uncharacterized delta-60 repeat protein
MRTTLVHRWLALVLAAVVLTLPLTPAPAAAAPGDLDPSFGSGGRVSLDLDSGDFGFGGALAPDGDVLIVGDTDWPADRAPGVARFTLGGAPDPAFGGGSGFVTVNPSPAAPDFIENVQLQPDGKIVVGGSFDGSAGILRYGADGLPDAGFDGDGIVKTGFGHPQRAGGIQLLPAGRILWFGRGDYPGGAQNLDLVRYQANGSVDMTFGAGGLVSHSLRPGANLEQYHAVLRQPDGRILVGGEIFRPATGAEDWVIVRVHPNGALDSSFDGDGSLVMHFSGSDYLHDLALQANGRIVAVGVSAGAGDIAVARFLPDGAPDSTFDGDGRREVDLGGNETGQGVVVQQNGKIAVAGFTDVAGTTDMVVSRLLPDGALDGGFGVGGRRVVDFDGGDDEAYDLLLQPDGKLVAVGWAVPGGALDFGAIRLEGDPPLARGPDRAVTIRVLGRRLRVSRRGIARLRLHCPRSEQSPPCAGRVLLMTRTKLRLAGRSAVRRRRVVLARGRFSIGAGRTRVVRLRFGGRKLRLLRRNRRARRAIAIVRVRDAAGNRRTVRKPLPVIPPRRLG